MNSIHHPLIHFLPLVGVLLLVNLSESAETRTASGSEKISAPASPQIATTGDLGLRTKVLSHSRTISARLAAILAETRPVFVAPAQVSPSPPSNESATSLDLVDPVSDALRLPKYVVRGSKPMVLRERDVYTQRGLADLAQRRYISEFDHALNRYRLPLFGISTEARALAMYAEDERLKNMADLDRTARNVALVDRAAGAEIKRLAESAYQRTN